MDLTLLPYEILQLVADGLLPRYQCRLALVSKHHYRYLYNDLLRWHAHKARIPIPIHTTIPAKYPGDSEASLIYGGKDVVLYKLKSISDFRTLWTANELYIANYTTRAIIKLYDYGHVNYVSMRQVLIMGMMTVYFNTNWVRPYLIKPVYRKHLHKDVLIALVNTKRMPHTANFFIRKCIRDLLDPETLIPIQSCEHLHLHALIF